MSSLFKSMDISSSGLNAQRMRMNILSSNLANAQTTKSPEEGGEVYRRKDVIFEAAPLDKKADFASFLDPDFGTELKSVEVSGIHKDQKAPKRVFDPSHPHANQDGYVDMPNIDVMTEMVNMIAATRSYEANVSALNNAKQMAMKALEIGA